MLKANPLAIFYIIIFLSFSSGFSQTEKRLKGKLLDISNDTIIGASVVLKNSANEIITYTISDEKGNFELITTATGTNTLEISHISYALYTEIINLVETEISYPLEIVLQPNSNELDEVVIQGRKTIAQQRGDTLRYNLNVLTTGNEQKLKDIIEKLPGLEIDESGKIKSEGKVIENLLVDGKPFFGDNHKIATDNLNAKMIKGVDLIQNYENFSAVKDIEGSEETALNIQIKEEYQGKPTGNIEAYGAYKERYRFHTNLFSFAKTHNVSFIGDLNNTGQQPISLLDFLQMDKSTNIKNAEDEISSINTNSNLPSFLFDNDNRTKQQSKFGALNAVFTPFKNVAIDAFSILDIENINSEQFSSREYFSQNETIYSEELIQDDNDFLINQTNINIEYKPVTNGLLQYALNYNPHKNEFYTTIDGEVDAKQQNTVQKINSKGYSLGQNLGYTTRLARNKLFSVHAFSNVGREYTQLYLLSNQILFDINDSINQQTKNNIEESGLYSKYTQRIKNHILKFNLGYVWQESEFYNTSFSKDSINTNSQNYGYAGTSIEKKEGFFQYKALLNLRNYELSYQQKNENTWLFLPALESKLQFSERHYTSFKYTRQTGFSVAEQLNAFSYAIDYRNFRLASVAENQIPILNDRFEFQYFYLNLYSGTQVFFNSLYNESKNYIGVNSEVVGSYNYSTTLNTPYKSNWINTLRFQTRIKPLKVIFKTNLEYTRNVFNNYVSAIQNKAINKRYIIKPSLTSYYKDAWLNYELGVDYEQNNTLFEVTQLENRGRKLSPFINLKGVFAQYWSYCLNNAWSFYKTENIERDFYQLDFEVKYHKSDSKFSYWLSGENILNISSTEIVEANALQNSISRNVIYRMPGYIGVGASYDF